MNQIITNEELQKQLSEKIRSMDDGSGDPGHTKIFFAGARTLLGSVKLDVEGAKKLGVPLFGRTKTFLGVQE